MALHYKISSYLALTKLQNCTHIIFFLPHGSWLWASLLYQCLPWTISVKELLPNWSTCVAAVFWTSCRRTTSKDLSDTLINNKESSKSLHQNAGNLGTDQPGSSPEGKQSATLWRLFGTEQGRIVIGAQNLTFELLQRLEVWIQMEGGISLKDNRTTSVALKVGEPGLRVSTSTKTREELI